ncbi:hypothetical protein ELH27_37050 [Rhizobium leguminosarum]|uniref:Uncharacterized protein n=1 Tax=Rhizobium beringeri TaxID=3019934 RepID=A0ABY1XH02_9HYPH|nr:MULTISPECIES: hypothetical protein [Rhizobium]TBC53777.1 hypothetical protein ELH27_37050 [Rhizobium leguminosarum]TBE57586.1 hypothetical protein ELH03_37005 [Rhizobium beringeri]
MSANDFSKSSLAQAEGEVEAAAQVATARVERLLRQSFENGNHAVAKYQDLLQARGPDVVIGILEDRKGWGDRVYHFGFLKHGFFQFEKQRQVRQSLAELPKAIQDHAQLLTQLQDLKAARRNLIDREDTRRFERSDDDRDRPSPRDRPRR